MPKVCEICSKEIENYWGYLSDLYPDFYPPRDRSKDQTLWGTQVAKPGGKFEFHYFCSEEHGNDWIENRVEKGGGNERTN